MWQTCLSHRQGLGRMISTTVLSFVLFLKSLLKMASNQRMSCRRLVWTTSSFCLIVAAISFSILNMQEDSKDIAFEDIDLGFDTETSRSH